MISAYGCTHPYFLRDVATECYSFPFNRRRRKSHLSRSQRPSDKTVKLTVKFKCKFFLKMGLESHLLIIQDPSHDAYIFRQINKQNAGNHCNSTLRMDIAPCVELQTLRAPSDNNIMCMFARLI